MEIENPQNQTKKAPYSNYVQHLRMSYARDTENGLIPLPNGKPTENILRKIEPEYQSHVAGKKSYMVTLKNGSKVLINYELVRATRRIKD
jgi:hypothetical protein